MKILIFSLVIAVGIRGVTICDAEDQDNPFVCSENEICCRMNDNSWGCCPFTEGICCPGMDTCCPINTKCTKEGCILDLV